MHNPRGRHSRQRAELYIVIMTIPGLKAIKCLVLTKSIYYDNLPTIETRIYQERGVFQQLLGLRGSYSLKIPIWRMAGELAEAMPSQDIPGSLPELQWVLSCFSRVQLFAILWTVVHQVPPSMEFSRQENWSGLPFPSPGVFPTQGLNVGLLHYRQLLYRLSNQGLISPKGNTDIQTLKT